MTLKNRKLLTILFSLVGIPLFFFGVQAYSFLTRAVAPIEAQLVVVAPGSSFARTAIDLQNAGVISNAQHFALLGRWRDATESIHAGEYFFEQPATPDEVLARLVAGDVRKFRLTIPEGLVLKQIAQRVEQAEIGPADAFLELARSAELAEQLGIEGDTFEGYLFPETYTVRAGTSLEALLKTMLAQLEAQLTPELLEQAARHGLNRHQLVTLASIIEKEAGNVQEMPLISAAFHNRLKRGIPLQADPTVIYGVADFNGNLTRKHLETPTPYNTYRMRGLPPGPIANPGLAALSAAANPAESKVIYFVSRGDGTHEFNETLAGHNAAVQRFQKRR